jgi:arginase family enzyme
VLWLDAHGDFNTPDTTASAFLGGMCLAAACGRLEDGLGVEAFDPARVVTCGVRDFEEAERAEAEAAGVILAERPSLVADLVRGRAVYVHLDLDVLDPTVFPAQFPVDGGLSMTGLRTLLAEVAEAAERIIGLEVTSLEAPPDPDEATRLAETVAGTIAPLL